MLKELKGRKLAIASWETELPASVVHAYRSRWRKDGYRVRGEDQPPVVPKDVSRIGHNLKEIINRELPGAKSCSKCEKLLRELNQMTVEEVKADIDRIADDIASRAPTQAPKLWQRMVAHIDQAADLGLIVGRIHSWIIEACKAKREVAKRPRRSGGRPKRTRRAYIGWRGLKDEEPKHQLGPFETTVRHLTYHVWPNDLDSLQWNLRQLAKRWDLFNGKRVLGIATDDSTATKQDVVAPCKSLGLTFDTIIHRTNKPKLREVVTWLPMLDAIGIDSAEPDEVVFSAHAKGQKYDDPSHTRNWTDLMYRSCLDYWPLVRKQLSQSLMTGSFREFGLLGKWHDWAYSGTFYWWRAAELAKRPWRNVDQWFAGTESWPGKLCEPQETDCIFLNNNTRLYVDSYWTQTVWPAWRKFVDENEVYHAR